MFLTRNREKGCGFPGGGGASAGGVTLVELLIAAALLGLVSLGFGFIYVVAQRNLVRNANFVAAQSEAAFAMEHIKRNLFLASDITVPAVGTNGAILIFTSQPDLALPPITSTYQLNGQTLEYERDSGNGFAGVAAGMSDLFFDRADLYSVFVRVRTVWTSAGDTQGEELTSTVTPRGIF